MTTSAPETSAAARRYSGVITDPDRWSLFSPRRGDIIVCTPSKCGTTWTQAMIAHLLHGGGNLPMPVTQFSPWIDGGFEDDDAAAVGARLAAASGRRLVKTHTPGDGYPVWDGVHVVAVYRHPLDVFFSARKHLANAVRIKEHPMTEEIPQALRYYLNESFRDDAVDGDTLDILVSHYRRTLAARPAGSLTVLHYADMIADHAGTIRRLAAELEIEADADVVARVAEATEFGSMKKRAGDYAPQAGTGFWANDTAFFNSGGTQKWRGALSDADLAEYSARMEELVPEPDLRHWLENGGAFGHRT